MKITIIGTGYVGSVTGACLADLGNEVICLDVDKEKIEKFSKGIIPIYEPGLSDHVKRNVREKRLTFTTDSRKAIQGSDVIFIAVGTPSNDDGSVDMRYIDSAAADIGRHMNCYKVIVDKSTVPVGTADKVKDIIRKNQKEKHDFDLVSNPEFLREGEAIKDFMNPDRVVIGVENAKAREMMLEIYKGIERTGKPVLVTDVKTAEMIKYASNAMLATRISFMNELARLCEKAGADIKMVAKGMGLDTRIGPRFLQAGVGYGGSCFPKDVKGLISTAKDYGIDMKIVTAVEEVNEEQKRWMIPKIKKELGDLKNKRIAIWGLAFKPKTDDMREAPSITIINELQKEGAKITAFDPEAEHTAKHILKNIDYTKDPYETLKGCDALVIVTEWDEFRNLDLNKVKSMLKRPIVFDGRNIYEPKEMRKLGFIYHGVGR
ncbi:UDP-glucose 6-dehydrogenase [Candidatus Woesearchaeota archaeon CG10_big_fil_rev_8_21_14_0_10_44_13]|nr:MAG: UDP-glucose 6-dehydrogenase [Candidatus Woesearchaeota archaeon CG10_big_fil_rev_8_21_14_0_10_44_13]